MSVDLELMSRHSSRVIKLEAGCHYFPPGARLPSQMQSIIAIYPQLFGFYEQPAQHHPVKVEWLVGVKLMTCLSLCTAQR